MGSSVRSPSSTYSPTQNSATNDSHDTADSHNDSHNKSTVDSHDHAESNVYNIQNGLNDNQVDSLLNLIGKQSDTMGKFGSDALASMNNMAGFMMQMMGSLGQSLFGAMGSKTASLF
ncbi:flagellar hook-associated protein FlgK [Variovorax boronicumulans]|nr:flagellar hook-associated protein FlgK [Variovorax boronicumulans]